jgi:septum formation topological specificity factor MinE
MRKHSPAKIGVDRLKKVLISDKHFNPERIKEVIKSDILYILKNYTDVEADDLNFEIDVNEEGGYKINIDANCTRLKVLGSIPE